MKKRVIFKIVTIIILIGILIASCYLLLLKTKGIDIRFCIPVDEEEAEYKIYFNDERLFQGQKMTPSEFTNQACTKVKTIFTLDSSDKANIVVEVAKGETVKKYEESIDMDLYTCQESSGSYYVEIRYSEAYIPGIYTSGPFCGE